MYARRLHHVWHGCQFGVFPKVFQIIELSYFRLEDVYEYIHKVDGYPLVVSQSCYVDRFLAQLLTAEVAY